MKFYQGTGLGDSTTLMRGPLLPLLLQVRCQGNDMAPAWWITISAVLMHYYKRTGFGASIVTPITGRIIEFLGTICVGDTDLNMMGDNLRISEQV